MNILFRNLTAFILVFAMFLSFVACDKSGDSLQDNILVADSDSVTYDIPAAVIKEIDAYFAEDLKAEKGFLKAEYNFTAHGAYYYVVSCEIKSSEDENSKEYEGGFFFGFAYGSGEMARFVPTGKAYKKGEEQLFDEALKTFINEINKEELKNNLKYVADEAKDSMD